MFEEIIMQLDKLDTIVTCHSVCICLLNIAFWLYFVLHNHK